MLAAKKALGPCAPTVMTNLTAVRVALIKYRFRRLGPYSIVEAMRQLARHLYALCTRCRMRKQDDDYKPSSGKRAYESSRPMEDGSKVNVMLNDSEQEIEYAKA